MIQVRTEKQEQKSEQKKTSFIYDNITSMIYICKCNLTVFFLSRSWFLSPTNRKKQ